LFRAPQRDASTHTLSGSQLIAETGGCREGHFLAVQIPSDDCEILAKVTPPGSLHDGRQFRSEKAKRAA